MTKTHIAAARQWIERLRGELSKLERDPRAQTKQQIADGIREELARVEQVIRREHTSSTRAMPA